MRSIPLQFPQPLVIALAACASLSLCGQVQVLGADGAATKSTTPESDRRRSEFFENRVRPLLVENCFDCHNADTQEGNLRLDSLQAMLDGGDRGPAIEPGNSKNSLLIHAVNHSEADLQMPEGDKLRAVEIQDLAKWIDNGAVWPGQLASRRDVTEDGGELFTDEDRAFWAFQRPALPKLPSVDDDKWIQSDIDRFVLARLEERGLAPAPPASKAALLRRVHFDLIGLPPTPDQVTNFLQDNSPQAFEHVIDRLLASPQYGERWGRHWLDVARYADSNGLDENWAFEFIYKYRDWVINVFNQDLPYDQFVTHQIAGDLIKQKHDETQEDYIHRVAAAGFLSMGPKMIADDDPKKKKMDIIDEQLSTVSQTFMALTVGCARCHDHKFDPIPTWDYYAMAGIFKSTKTMEHLRVVAPVSLHEFKPEGYEEAFATFDSKRKELVKQRDEFWIRVAQSAWRADANRPGKKNLNNSKERSFKLPKKADRYVPDSARDEWNKLKAELVRHEAMAPQSVKVMAPTDGEPENLRVSLRGNYLTLGKQTQRQFLRIIDGDESPTIRTNQSGRLELARWIASPDHPLTARVMVNRIWRWRFGRGLVATTDNFGKLGDRPSHPGLLDWLAVKFMDDGWSLKRLHKRMLLSSTYQMSTEFDERSATVDPENRLWWRFPRRRLEAEAIRDSLLFVSGNLDRTMGGSLMPLKDRTYVTGTASKTQEYDNPRRTVYQPVYRSAVYDVLTAFDFPDPATPNGDRKNSTVAPQALLMMNSPLVTAAARRIAARLLVELDSDEERIRELYRVSVSREPTSRELSAIRLHLGRDQADAGHDQLEQSWMGICRVVLSSNEFLFLE